MTRGGRAVSLRFRLVLGIGLIAALATVAAFLAAYGAAESARRLEATASAERRLELLGALSSRIGDYAVVAIEQATAPGLSDAERRQRLAARADTVRQTFARLDDALVRAVQEARDLGAAEQAGRAARSLGLARMRAHFEALDRALARSGRLGDLERLRAELDSFATQVSPLLNQAVAEERRLRDRASEEAERLRGQLLAAAAAVVGGAALAVLLFHLGVTRPLIARLRAASAATAEIGRGGFGTRLDTRAKDELGLLFAQLNRAAARLGRDRAAVEAERARLEETVLERTRALREANARLERIDADRRRFFADLGHELRTPLTVILAEADLNLGTRDLDPDEARASFETIRARARRLNRRIDDILRVARSETGQIELAEAPFDLGEAAAGAVEDVEGSARRRRVAIALDAAQPVLVRGDRDWTRQVLAGFLDNAIRHSPEGGRIRVDLALEGAAGAASVTDEGGGIPPAEQTAVFDRFVRGRSGARGGFGVGLALARWIAERQSGSVVLSSPAPRPVAPDARGAGTELRLRLPLAAEARAAAGQPGRD